MRLFITLFIILFSSTGFSNEAYTVKSKIKNVIVYQQGAQINRQGNYAVSKGVTELKISGVSPQIDANTLQIKATGNIVILDSRHTIFYPEPVNPNPNGTAIPPKIKREITLLEDSLFNLSFEMTDFNNQINVLTTEKRIIEKNSAVNGGGKANDSIPLLQDALAYYHKRVNEINKELLKLERTKILLTRKQNRMNNRLTELNNYNRNNQFIPTQNTAPIHEIIVTVSADQSATGRVNVSYLVNSAGWTPLYDLRSNNDGKTIDLTYKAQVYQNTGIDWEETPLNLSTNNPYENKTKPELNPWYLDYFANIPPPVQRDKQVKKAENTADEDQYYSGRFNSETTQSLNEVNAPALDAASFVSTVQQLVSVEYAIDLPYTIKSNGQKNMVLVKTAELKTNYLYYTVPKIDPSVYLVAQITNLDELNLIPGNATIFHDGSYLGNTYLNPATLSDTMDLSLGKTANISVKRTLMKNNVKEKVIGDKIVKTFAYKIELKNRNQETIELIIEDQVPRSRKDEIEVEIDDLSKGNLNEINGLIKWNKKLRAGESEVLELIYTVTYEKNKPINLSMN